MAVASAGWAGVVACFVASASFALIGASQYPCIKSEWKCMLTFLNFGSLSLLGLIKLHFLIGEALGLDWVAMAWLLSGVDQYDLFAKGAVMVCFHLRYSVIFLLKDGKGLTSVPRRLGYREYEEGSTFCVLTAALHIGVVKHTGPHSTPKSLMSASL